MQMYEALRDTDDNAAPEPRDMARQQRRSERRTHFVFFGLIATNLITLLVALYLGQRLYNVPECNS